MFTLRVWKKEVFTVLCIIAINKKSLLTCLVVDYILCQQYFISTCCIDETICCWLVDNIVC